MTAEAPGKPGWLSDPSTCAFFSMHLQAAGRAILLQVRNQHFPPGFARLLYQSLRQPGKLLGKPVMRGGLLEASDLHLWALLALLAAASAPVPEAPPLTRRPAFFWRRAHAAAAAAELLGTALDVIDDVQDSDGDFVRRVSAPVAVNVGVALLELVPLALEQARLAEWPDALAESALRAVHTGVLTSLGGQYLDLRYERTNKVTQTQVLEMTSQKSGTLLALVCRLGAMAGLSSTSPKTEAYVEAISLFGWQLGVWFQLLNDLHDAEQTQSGKSDRKRRKKTLPLLLEQWGMMEKAQESQAQWSSDAQAAYSYTYTVAEICRFRAQNVLAALEEAFGPQPLLWPLVAVSWESG